MKTENANRSYIEFHIFYFFKIFKNDLSRYTGDLYFLLVPAWIYSCRGYCRCQRDIRVLNIERHAVRGAQLSLPLSVFVSLVVLIGNVLVFYKKDAYQL